MSTASEALRKNNFAICFCSSFGDDRRHPIGPSIHRRTLFVGAIVLIVARGHAAFGMVQQFADDDPIDAKPRQISRARMPEVVQMPVVDTRYSIQVLPLLSTIP
jgi:hypothetical protein